MVTKSSWDNWSSPKREQTKQHIKLGPPDRHPAETTGGSPLAKVSWNFCLCSRPRWSRTSPQRRLPNKRTNSSRWHGQVSSRNDWGSHAESHGTSWWRFQQSRAFSGMTSGFSPNAGHCYTLRETAVISVGNCLPSSFSKGHNSHCYFPISLTEPRVQPDTKGGVWKVLGINMLCQQPQKSMTLC